MSAARRAFLVFDGTWLEVEASLAERRGGLRAVAREAERKWDLQPGTYQIRHESVKVDSPQALQRALDGVGDGVCRLDISENAEGKMMRTMRMEMKRLEDRVMAKVEAALVEVRGTDAKISSGIVPIVQCMATEQIELRNKLGQLFAEVSATPQESHSVPINLKDAEDLERELQQECAMQAASDLDLLNEENLDLLKEEVCHLDQKPTCESVQSMPAKTALQCDLMNMDSTRSIGYRDAWLNGPKAPVAGISYSSKGQSFDVKWRAGEKWSSVQLGHDMSVPFAQSTMAPQQRLGKSTIGHRSCPTLLPLY
jgi:hypothetical protein